MRGVHGLPFLGVLAAWAVAFDFGHNEGRSFPARVNLSEQIAVGVLLGGDRAQLPDQQAGLSDDEKREFNQVIHRLGAPGGCNDVTRKPERLGVTAELRKGNRRLCGERASVRGDLNQDAVGAG